MISDERLEDIANNPSNHWDRDTIGTMAQELLLLREQIKELEHFIQKNNLVCSECGQSGLDCHNYQG